MHARWRKCIRAQLHACSRFDARAHDHARTRPHACTATGAASQWEGVLPYSRRMRARMKERILEREGVEMHIALVQTDTCGCGANLDVRLRIYVHARTHARTHDGLTHALAHAYARTCTRIRYRHTILDRAVRFGRDILIGIGYINGPSLS
eukprot:6212125-Pleurochrysis_carterae.AAC.2